MFLATSLRAVAHESQEAALPAVSLAQHTLYCLMGRVKGNENKTRGQASASPAQPTFPALPWLTQIHHVTLGRSLHLSDPSSSVKWG